MRPDLLGFPLGCQPGDRRDPRGKRCYTKMLTHDNVCRCIPCADARQAGISRRQEAAVEAIRRRIGGVGARGDGQGAGGTEARTLAVRRVRRLWEARAQPLR
ncbi:hypothetical protein CSE45_3088 [Citreicella sp. SE45]|nr:hypothetical protein CSE45_3088 [Citreicella sp. SE45]